jgi:isoquinoline 1-oxidoreductase subunit alpha
MQLTVNGLARLIRAPPDTPLLWVIREELELTGTKYGCGIGVCGVCTVHLDGTAVPSCVLPVGQAEGSEVTTIGARQLSARPRAEHRSPAPW